MTSSCAFCYGFSSESRYFINSYYPYMYNK